MEDNKVSMYQYLKPGGCRATGSYVEIVAHDLKEANAKYARLYNVGEWEANDSILQILPIEWINAYESASGHAH